MKIENSRRTWVRLWLAACAFLVATMASAAVVISVAEQRTLVQAKRPQTNSFASSSAAIDPPDRSLVPGFNNNPALVVSPPAHPPIRPSRLPRDDMTTANPSGWLRSFNRLGKIDTNNAFFQSIGSNGRSCNSCHQMEAAWSITPARIHARFQMTAGTDPIFRTVDGANSPLADVSTVAARRDAYSMLLNRGLIRVGIGIPENAEFELIAVDDPYGFASAAELSLFRRPLPATNLGFLTGIMWDGRENVAAFSPPMHAGQFNDALEQALIQQAIHATTGHAQGLDPSPEQVAEIVAFETGLSTAQVFDFRAGWLNEQDALGGPRILSLQRFYIGINDTLNADPSGALFDQGAMTLFAAWDEPHGRDLRTRSNRARAAIVRGERLFNEHPLTITDVGGFNDALGQIEIPGTCSSCHNTPNVGNHSLGLPLDIGLTDALRRTPDMPLYTLQNKITGATVQTSDPGMALLTGKWDDIAKFKGPILRGLAARPPYFHNGFAASLEEVVDFYDERFAMELTDQEKSDLVAFLQAL